MADLRSGKKRKDAPEAYVPSGSPQWKEHKHELMKEAKKAVPSIFAKPGDRFQVFLDYPEELMLEYVGKNERASVEVTTDDGKTVTTPKEGWLIFKEAHGPGGPGWTRYDIGWSVRDLIGAKPYAAYSLYDESGEYDKEMLCIPPSMCGYLLKEEMYEPEDRLKALEAEEKEVVPFSAELLLQARSAAPALLAKPGDRFAWTVRSKKNSSYHDATVLTYVGRNAVPPEKLDTSAVPDYQIYKQPELGWLIFRGKERQIDAANGFIRDALNAYPWLVFSQYNERGQTIKGTIMLPPEKIGPLKNYIGSKHAPLY